MNISKNKFFILAFAVVVLAAIFVLRDPSGHITNYPSQGKDVIAFGDSLVSGVGASAQSRSFVSLLSAMSGRPIVNLGVPGNTTADGLARLSELDQYDPEVVLVLLGGNDHLRRVPIDTTFENLARIIENIHARGAVVVLLGVRGSVLGDRFESRFEELRDTHQTAYVSDVLDGLFGNANYMSDTVHPNDFGHKRIAEKVFPVLKEVLGE